MRAFVVLCVLGWLSGACAGGRDLQPSAANAGADHEAREPVDAGALPHHEPIEPNEPEPVDPVKPAQARDAGVAPRDAGQPASNDASTPPPTDAGSKPQPMIDAGSAPVVHKDASTPGFDAAVDAGQPHQDAGDVFDAGLDSGTPAYDAGNPFDSGVPATDSGMDSGPVELDAGDPSLDAGSDAAAPSCYGPPGLYQDTTCQVLSDDVQPYHPQYPLWSDGADKERWIYLPPGTRIDTTNPDRWTFPRGTRLYKTFAAGTLKVETRVLEKTGTSASFDSWTLTSYAWSADQRSVSPASASGVTNALGTGLDIPSQAQCRSCHNMTGADAAIGFNAIQLNHQAAGLTLADLLDADLLATSTGSLNISSSNARIPGDATARAALGYLHGNCGHCHGGPNPRAGQSLWAVVGMADLDEAPIMSSAVCRCLENWTGRSNTSGEPYELRVAPSHAAISGILGRMNLRGAGEQMPPIGTKLIDTAGVNAVKSWITSLDGASCDNAPPICKP